MRLYTPAGWIGDDEEDNSNADGPKGKGKYFDRKILALFLVCLSISMLTGFELVQVLATPAPSVNRVVTPGATGPCDWYMYMDGTTPVAEAMDQGLSVSPGDNIVGTAGQDPAAFMNSNLVAVNTTVCLSSQTFITASSITSTVAAFRLTGNGYGSVLKPSSGTFDVINANGNDLILEYMTIDTSSMTGGYAIHTGSTTTSNRLTIRNLSLQIGSTTGGIWDDFHTGVAFIYANRIQSVLAPSGNAIQMSSVADQHIFENDIGGFGGGATIACSGCTDVDISGNQLYVGLFGIDLYLPKEVRVVGNHIGSFQQQGIRLHNDLSSSYGGVTIAGNEFGTQGTSGTKPWDIDYYLQSSGTIANVAITGNSFVAGSKTVAGINLENGPTNMTITGNTFSNVTPIIYSAGITPTRLIIQDNAGYNPVNKVTNFVSSSLIAPWGTTATVVASTDYTVSGVSIFLTSTGGTGVSITVKDGAGNTVTGLSALATITAQYLPFGYKINFGAFSGAPTVTVFGN